MMPVDVHKIFIDDQSYHSGHGHAYEYYGIHPNRGAIAIVRPDGCKYWINPGLTPPTLLYPCCMLTQRRRFYASGGRGSWKY